MKMSFLAAKILEQIELHGDSEVMIAGVPVTSVEMVEGMGNDPAYLDIVGG